MVLKKRIRHLCFDLLYYTRAFHIMQGRRSGLGVIFLLHRVVPEGTPILATDLSIQSDFLDQMLDYIRRLRWEIINLTEVRRRVVDGKKGAHFASFTFDDGYLDNLTIALPIFRKHNAPMCVNITTGLIDQTHFLWWPVLEHMALSRDRIQTLATGDHEVIRNETREEQTLTFKTFSPLLRGSEQEKAKLQELFRVNGVDPEATLRPLILSWQQARELASDPLVEIGCHTVSHPPLATIKDDELVRELASARERLQEQLAVPVHHLSYPYGRKADCSSREFRVARELGFHTATTTRPGNIFPAHKDHLTALPRVNIPGGDRATLRVIREGLFGESLRPNYAPALVTD